MHEFAVAPTSTNKANVISGYFLTLVMALTAVSSEVRAEQTIVSPREFAASDAPGLNYPGLFGGRMQILYDAEDFQNVPNDLGYISGFSFRADAANTWDGIVHGPAHIQLSTTRNETLTSTYLENTGADQTDVFHGTLSWNVHDSRDEDNHEFNFEVNFDTPFPYDSSKGNLVLDFEIGRTWEAERWWAIDRQHNSDENEMTTFVFGDQTSIDNARSTSRSRLPAAFQFVDPVRGDANFDGAFNSRDLVAVFQANEYEDSISGNSRWNTGDWNGDLEFSTSDLVKAFSDGMYNVQNRNTVAVPEPEFARFSLIAVLLFARALRKRKSPLGTGI